MKLAVIFPGIGYHTDKPLLYYSKKLAAGYGFEIVEVPYGNFPAGVKGSKEKMMQAFQSALEQSEEILKDVEFDKYDIILFISKSVGTAVAAAYAGKKKLSTKNIFYTPVQETLEIMSGEGLDFDEPDFQRTPFSGTLSQEIPFYGILFHGTKDPWAETEPLVRGCKERGYPMHIIENANHSLETGEVLLDIRNMESIMKITDDYIRSLI